MIWVIGKNEMKFHNITFTLIIRSCEPIKDEPNYDNALHESE